MSKELTSKQEFFHLLSKLYRGIAVALEERCKIYFDIAETTKLELFCMEHIYRVKEANKTKYVYKKPIMIKSEPVIVDDIVIEEGKEFIKNYQHITVAFVKHENLGIFEEDMKFKFKEA